MINRKICSFVCNNDGKILSFNNDCEKFFGYTYDFITKTKRIYNLLHADFVIDFISKFDSFKSNDVNKLFVYKANIIIYNRIDAVFFQFKKRFNNKFIIIDVFKNDFIFSKPKKKLFEKLNIIFRTKFTLGSLFPFFFSFFASINKFDVYSYAIFCLLFLGLLFFHIAANTLNDYFDWKSGRDDLNVDYILFSTGGSRALDFKLISEKHMLFVSVFNLLIVVFCGICLLFLRGYIIFILGVIGIFSVYFYSAPPIHLASRYGLGELMHIICLGPLIVYGCVFSFTGYASYQDFFIGMPFGFLITACLLLNEVPDSKFDKISNKNNLAVFLGIKNIAPAFYFLVFWGFLSLILNIYFFNLSLLYFFSLFLLPYVFSSTKFLYNIDKSRSFILKSCEIGFNIYLYFGLCLIFFTVLNTFFCFYPW